MRSFIIFKHHFQIIFKSRNYFSISNDFPNKIDETIDLNSNDNKEESLEKPKKVHRFSLSPHAFWLTQAKGMEKPFTGDYWFTKELGEYKCIACNNKLFL